MKYLKKITLAIGVVTIASIAWLTGCSSDPGSVSPQEKFIKKISGTWKLNPGSVTVDGIDVTNAFSGFEISFEEDGSFVVTNPIDPIWPPTGIFELQSDGALPAMIVRSEDGVIITITQLTDNRLNYNFNFSGASGRFASVNGFYEFVMTR